MRHESKQRTLSRSRSQRRALLRGLAIALIENGQITTTTAKAKELRPFAERLVTYGKQGTVAARRLVATKLGEPKNTVIKKLFEDIASRYQERAGGYTRVVKIGRQDGRDQAVIEFV